jgi:hypothetical protein
LQPQQRQSLSMAVEGAPFVGAGMSLDNWMDGLDGWIDCWEYILTVLCGFIYAYMYCVAEQAHNCQTYGSIRNVCLYYTASEYSW